MGTGGSKSKGRSEGKAKKKGSATVETTEGNLTSKTEEGGSSTADINTTTHKTPELELESATTMAMEEFVEAVVGKASEFGDNE